MGATAAAASPSVPAPRVPDAGDVAGDTDRRARRIRLAGRGVQFAALGGATLALAAASGFVLWAAEGTGTPRQIGTSGLTSPTEAGGPAAAMVPPGGPPPGPPPGDLTPPEFTEHGEDAPVRQTRTRSPITDVTTLPRRAPVRPPVSPAPPVTTVPTSPTTGTSTSTPTSSTTAPTSSSGSTSTVPPSSRAPGAATLAAP
jgi:hypothetical protein